MEQQRLNKYIAACGICSRREADQMIQDGLVLVNGRKASPGEKVDGSEKITVKGKRIGTTFQKVVLAFYKPIGVTVTKSDPHAQKTIMQYIDYPVPVTYAGRLDRDSEGLILLTNDGKLIDALMRGKNGHEKEYLVKLNKQVKSVDIQNLRQGVFLRELNRKTRECEITQISKYSVRMVITEGMNRQIRRMWKTAGYEVQALKRIRVANIQLGHLAPGTYRVLSEAEREELYRLTFQKRTEKRGDEA
ncbi:MAG: pseudouridine synthase [Lachnospiraceae bacterium]